MDEKLKDYIELTKPRILSLVLVITALGYYLGSRGEIRYIRLILLLIGTSLICAGAAALNHYLERELDRKMERTQKRPLPDGRIEPQSAFIFGVILTLCGIFVLYVGANKLTAFLGMLTTFMYILVYTPLKRISWLNTSVGAIPGAIPTLGGWAAATGTLEFSAGILFLILFIWQHPHFYAIAWMCKDEYKSAGFKMLPCIEPDGNRMFLHVIVYSVLLIPVSVIPSFIGLSGNLYLFGTLLAGILLLFVSIEASRSRSIASARNLLKATVVYLPVLLFLIVIDANF